MTKILVSFYFIQKSLLTRASQYFNVELIKRDYYSPNVFSEFDDLSDEERLIAFCLMMAANYHILFLRPGMALVESLYPSRLRKEQAPDLPKHR